MRYSDSYIPTLKETPADADVVSHQLLQRAGMIRKLASGLYTYLPLGLKALRRIETILRDEMERAGFRELLMPMVQPGDLWRESGRWEKYGKELLRLKDRNDRDYCLGPTHEEVITDLVRDEIRSYKQLPARLFQIQTKFRDEIRPRFGLMRGREFLMKDGYSFDADQESARESYERARDAYDRVFKRLGLNFRAVEADTGSIGGAFSHEFMVLADAGEDTIAVCRDCAFASNLERAEVVAGSGGEASACPPLEKVATPGLHSAAEVAQFLGATPDRAIKTMIFEADGKPVAVLVRGDREVNEIKLKKFLNAENVELASPETVRSVTAAPLGFAGPVGLKIPVYADNELASGTDYIVGANDADAHLIHADLRRDASGAVYGDFRNIAVDDPCPVCGGSIELKKGIEVGHVFMLDKKYSEPMGACFLDENGKEQTMIMGCYGIGVSRILAAAIEQNHDDKGLLWPPAIAPVDCIVLNLDPKNEETREAVSKIAAELDALGLETLVDDRPERPGVKFNDADLLGVPIQLIIGSRGLARGVAEYKDRRSGEKGEIAVSEFVAEFPALRERVLNGWREAKS